MKSWQILPSRRRFVEDSPRYGGIKKPGNAGFS
jgi:hypothetical protein